VRAQWGGRDALWVFGYASLIWRPEFDAVEQRPATVHGWHRALEMRSTVNRGTPECAGWCSRWCRVARAAAWPTACTMHADSELDRLWAREMPPASTTRSGCRAARAGTVRALAFTLSRSSPSYVGRWPTRRCWDPAHRARPLRHDAGLPGRHGGIAARLRHPRLARSTLVELARRMAAA
jgi:cation transport regulator ChaC